MTNNDSDGTAETKETVHSPLTMEESLPDHQTSSNGPQEIERVDPSVEERHTNGATNNEAVDINPVVVDSEKLEPSKEVVHETSDSASALEVLQPTQQKADEVGDQILNLK